MNPWNYLKNVLHGRIPPPSGQSLQIRGAAETSYPLVAAAAVHNLDRPAIILLPDNEAAEQFSDQFRWHLAAAADTPDEVVFYPDLEVSPYRRLSPHPRLMEQRCQALWLLLEGQARHLVTTPGALLDRLPKPEEFITRMISLRISGEVSLTRMRRLLFQSGYKLEDPVTETGEFAIRGGVLDVFPPNHPRPLRIEFFGDFIDSIRYFDADTQRSIQPLDTATIIPMSPLGATPEDMNELLTRVEDRFSGEAFASALAEFRDNLGAGILPPGGEYLLPLLQVPTGSLIDYLEADVLLLGIGVDPTTRPDEIRDQLATQYEEALTHGTLCLPPEVHVIPRATLAEYLAGRPTVLFVDFGEDPAEVLRLRTTPTSSFLGNFASLAGYLQTSREHVLFLMSSHGRAERIHDLCEEYGIRHTWLDTFRWDRLSVEGDRRIVIAQGPPERGFRLPDIPLAVFGTEDVFPRTRKRKTTLRPSRYGTVSAFLSDFKDLKTGDFVVHLDHGVGLFHGLKKLDVAGSSQEFAHLEYADGAKLFVPAERMDLIQKFTGGENIRPNLDKLGGVTWEKTRSRVKRELRDMAEELLKIYARRSTAEGVVYPPDDQWQREFESMFEYDETPDQLQAISDIKGDMESTRPMDRLLCGDVGYGKTEVAMRAAFKAVTNGYQVAVLAPTTVLAFQHYNTFKNRFASFPVRIDLLSRFRTSTRQKETVQRLGDGQLDIVVGTHRLLSKDVRFNNLGLLIVDEEQRFGVTHKERIKKMRAEVDVLTLSATPIPRTLYMSLMGIRDISVIETPPKDRLSIQTQVVRFDDEVIAEAIRKELARNGQAYVVHNRVETIYGMADHLHRLVPEARIAVAHGQMKESELEKIIMDFVQYDYDVLLSTTIIENGIDIPLVNTIIINQAHRFGLSQLYQLRGRVGRSNRKAFAWLLVPSLDSLSDLARKRLAAIRDFSELGAGFRLAALDLEIRGSGNILGAEQHGHINAVGFDMYCRLMEETVKELQGEAFIAPEKIKINLAVRLRIPSSFIPQETQRLQLYKRIASVSDEGQLERLGEEILDRYGKFPEVMDYLLEYARLRLTSQQLHILSIDRRQDTFRIQFTEDSPIDPEKLVQHIQHGDPMSFSPDGMLTATLPFSTTREMFLVLKKTLWELVDHDKI